ncbi:MAG: PKD domain-containing protein, partial [Bacteroidia bacterium]|nr:PKD domain-containing protein [Bacteroidia bacterium]
MAHIEGTDAVMSLYITSDSNTSGTVSVPGQTWSSNFTVTANNLTVVTIPSNVAYSGCSDCVVSKAVKVTSLEDIIVYAHHYEGNKSDATLVLPTRTQGKDYYVMGYTQSSPNSTGRNVFIVVGSKDNTKVNITPGVDLRSNTGGTLAANNTYQITLDEGEIYQGIARYGSSSYDISGTHIEVIDTGMTANCRTVSVFSGSTYTRIGNCSGGWGTINSGDNLYEQMFPTKTWGTRFVLVPALGRTSDNFRFLASEDGTQVVIQKNAGYPDVLNLNKGEFGEITDVSTIRNVICNYPVMAAQFQKTSRCDGQNRVGDPSMTILNPLEQTLKDITLYSSQYYDIDNHYINVVIPTNAASSFRLDGNAQSFTTVPFNANYSYARLTVTNGNHRLTANQGFVATAYGEGEFESYGYAAGANVKDLTATIKMANSSQTTEISNCVGRGTKFQGAAEYNVVRWEWNFGDGSSDSVQNPTHVYADTGTYNVRLYTYKEEFDGCSVYDSAFLEVKIYDVPEAKLVRSVLCDSTTAYFTDSSFVPAPEEYNFTRWSINSGATLYGPNVTYTFDSVGKYELFMEVGTQHYCRDTIRDSITVSPRPVSNFSAANTCFKDSTVFVNSSTVLTGNIDSSLWEFTDTSGSFLKNPSHFYTDSGMHFITLTSVTDSGCRNSYTDSIYKLPRFVPQFEYLDTCFGFASLFENTTILEGGSFTDTIWYTSEIDTFETYDLTKTFASEGSYNVHLIMEQDSYCRDTFSQTVEIHPLALPDFTFADQCLGDSTTFTDVSNLSDGSYTLHWDFDDGIIGDQSVEKVLYAAMGTKGVTLTVTTDEGCETDTTKEVLITNPQITSLNISDMCLNSNQDIYGNYDLGLDSFLTFSWLIDNINTSTNDTFNYTPSSYGNRDIELTTTTKNGCELVYVDSFTVFDRPLPDFTVTEVCENKFVSPIDISSVNSPATIDKTLWYLDASFVSNASNPSIPVSSAGNYFLKLVIETNEGCTDSIIKTFNVNPLPVVDFLTGAQCFGDNTIFNDNSTISSGTNTIFNWLINGVPMNGASVSYSFPAVGDYNVQEIVTSAKGCTDTISKDVPVFPLPSIDVDLVRYT